MTSSTALTKQLVDSGGGVPDLPPALRTKPQNRDIGPGKLYADQTAFDADLAAWEVERAARAELVKERSRAMRRLRDQKRDRSGQPSGAQNRKAQGAREIEQARQKASEESCTGRQNCNLL